MAWGTKVYFLNILSFQVTQVFNSNFQILGISVLQNNVSSERNEKMKKNKKKSKKLEKEQRKKKKNQKRK